MATDFLPVSCTNSKVRQLMRRVAQHYEAELAASGIKITQYSLLSHAAKLAPIRPVDLASKTRMTASTLSRNLKPLIAAGWITLDAGVDARSRLVTVTQEGRAKLAQARRRWAIAQETLTVKLGADRIGALHELIDDSLRLLEAGPVTDEEEV